MAEFPHPDLIPRKFRHEIVLHEGNYVLRIDHGYGAEQKGVDLNVRDEDWQLTRKEWLERIIKPALSVLEASIAHG